MFVTVIDIPLLLHYNQFTFPSIRLHFCQKKYLCCFPSDFYGYSSKSILLVHIIMILLSLVLQTTWRAYFR